MIDQKYLKESLDYNSETGVFTWLDARPLGHFKNEHGRKIWKSKYGGQAAGCVSSSRGYLEIRVNSKLYFSHRLAWLYVFGQLPSDQIDHINGNRADNRIANLRDVNQQENLRNQKRRKTNKSGCTGVSWSRLKSRWGACISINGKNKHLGYFLCKEDAISVRKAAEIELGYHENHGKVRPHYGEAKE